MKVISLVLMVFAVLGGILQANPFLLVDGSPNPPGSPYVNITNNRGVSTSRGTLFPDVRVGETRRHKIRLRNIGSSILTYSVADNSSQFRVISPGAVLVPITGVREFEVEFAPTSVGTKNAVLTITSNDPNNGTFRVNLRGDGVAPEATILGGPTQSIVINDGDTSPRTQDFTDFGSRDLFDGARSVFFRLRNDGSDDLQFIGASVQAGQGFSISSLPAPASFLAPGQAHSFIISFDPSTVGTRTATVSVLTDDANEGVYTFDVRGRGTVTPDIAVLGSAPGLPDLLIMNGSTIPSTINGTLYESRSVGGIVRRTFEIRNEGTGTLDFEVSSSNSQFQIVALNTQSLPRGSDSSTSFFIDFQPASPGVKTATITIDSNDPDEDPYTFLVRGTGTAPEITVLGDTDFSEEIVNGDTSPRVGDGTNFLDVEVDGGRSIRTFRIKNDGNEPLTFLTANLSNFNGFFFESLPPTNFPIPPFGSVDFSVGFDPSTDGQVTTTVSLVTTDEDESPFTFNLTANGVGDPDIRIFGNYTSLQNQGEVINPGTLIPTFAQDTLFGEVDLGQTKSGRFAIRNFGDGTLNYSATVSGSDFEILNLEDTLEPNASSLDEFLIRFAPTSRGTKSALITITSNDPDTPSFVFAVEGTGTDPEMDIFGGEVLNVAIQNGALASGAAGTNFGTLTVNAPGETRTFSIFNSGERDLVIAAASLSDGTHFTLTGVPEVLSPIPPNSAAQFQITFEPQSAGRLSALVSMISNDDDENPYTFQVNGLGLDGPEFDLFGGDPLVEIQSGDTTPSAADGTDFGPVEVGVPLARVFTMRNEGNENLDFGNATITPGQGFDLGPLPLALLPGNETTLTVTFTPTAAGAATATVSIPNNDSDEGPYSFVVSGDGMPGDDPPSAEVVSGTGAIIPSGSLNATTAAGTYFPMVTEGEPLTASFVLRNTGATELTVTSQSGALFGGLASTIEAGGEDAFTISLPSATAGLKEATIQIGTDDPGQPIYTFAVRGIVLPEGGVEMSSLELVGTNAVVTYPTAPGLIYRFSTSPTMAEGSWIPGSMVAGTGLVRTITINNFVVPGEPRRFLRVEIVGPDDF